MSKPILRNLGEYTWFYGKICSDFWVDMYSYMGEVETKFPVNTSKIDFTINKEIVLLLIKNVMLQKHTILHTSEKYFQRLDFNSRFCNG